MSNYHDEPNFLYLMMIVIDFLLCTFFLGWKYVRNVYVKETIFSVVSVNVCYRKEIRPVPIIIHYCLSFLSACLESTLKSCSGGTFCKIHTWQFFCERCLWFWQFDVSQFLSWKKISFLYKNCWKVCSSNPFFVQKSWHFCGLILSWISNRYIVAMIFW